MTSNPKTLLGYHFPKTGGTSVTSHFTTHLAKDEATIYGPYSQVQQFFNAQPLFEELKVEERSKLKFICGHGVNDSIIKLLPHHEIALFFIYRDPYNHYVSQYNHKLNHMQTIGKYFSHEQFLKQGIANPASQALVKQFPSLISSHKTDLLEQVLEVLQCIQFLLCTEQLDEKIYILSNYLAINQPLTTKRVNYHKQVPEISREFIEKRNFVDFEIHSSIQQGKNFGFNPKKAKVLFEQLKEESNQSVLLEQAYQNLVEALAQNQKFEAARLQLQYELENKVNRLNQERYIELFSEAGSEKTSSKDKSLSAYYQATVHRKFKQGKQAKICFERAVKLNPKNTLARIQLGRIALNQKQYEQAIQHFEVVIKHDPYKARVYFQLARAKMILGQTRVALDTFYKGVQFTTNDEIIKEEFLKLYVQ